MIFEWTPGLRELLSDLPDSVYCFLTRTGSADTASGFNTVWIQVVKRAGLPDVHFHDLRGKAAADLEKVGGDYRGLRGHTSKAMSDKYLKGLKTHKAVSLNLVFEG